MLAAVIIEIIIVTCCFIGTVVVIKEPKYKLKPMNYTPKHNSESLMNLITTLQAQDFYLMYLHYISEGSVSHINGVWPSFLKFQLVCSNN